MTDAKETIDQLAEAAELADRGAQLRQRHSIAAEAGNDIAARGFREQAWLTYREAEVRVQIALGHRLRDQAEGIARTADEMKAMRDELKHDDD